VRIIEAARQPGTMAALPVAAVAVFAGIVSYSHIYALAVRTGQAGTAARLLPLSVDLLIVAGSVILLADSDRSRLGWLGPSTTHLSVAGGTLSSRGAHQD